MNTRNITTISLSILAIIVIAGGVWYARKGAPETPPVDDGTKGQVVDDAGDSVVDDGVRESEVDTSEWKMYRNEKLGFGLQMPKNWEVFSENYDVVLFSENGPIGDSITLFSSEKNIQGDPFGIYVKRISNPSEKSLIDFFEYAHSGDKVPNPIIEKATLGIDDLEFTLLYTESMSKDFFSKHFVKFINGNYYEIMYFNSGIIQLNKQVDEILDTLKFF